ncbi:histidine kinase [Algoriphagus sp. NF]|jgi:putative methionine-R-sulfoxide reductase with GAF domain|uniref:histidine kinase n=1 Tax=Algoriphagus sp. NF TaxID=2992756 RepID=UPI001066A0AE|nr:sensor histidine kinase [Algoriphagus sp. NF]MCR9081616.1 histidine kinase [Cyclobacteriaceae bacterium]MDE0558974.1 histidine kinase [Algoriphagus sp. NF]
MKTIQPKEIEEILLHFSSSLHHLMEEEDVVWDLVKNCIGILGFEDAVIYLVEGNYLVQKAAIGPKNPNEKEIINPLKIKIGEGITGKVASKGLPTIINDTREDSDYIPDDHFRLSEIAVPILLEGKVIGVIDSENSEANFFSQQHLQILTAVASIYSGQIARIRAEKKAKEEQQIRLELQRKSYQLQLEALSAQLSPHFVFNSLNAIQNHILSEDKRTSIRFLNIFGKLLRYFLSQLKEEFAWLGKEIQMVKWYLELQKLRYGQKITYEIKVSEGLNEENLKIPSIVVQNLIENLLEEQIQKADGEISIFVRFDLCGEFVKLQVRINDSTRAKKDRKNGNGQTVLPWNSIIDLINQVNTVDIKVETKEEPCLDKGQHCKIVNLALPIL